MQKTGQNASILIWAIFLSLIISLWFISISTQINKTIKNNIALQDNISLSTEQYSLLQSKNSDSQYISNWNYLKFEDTKTYLWSLKSDEIKLFSFSGTVLNFIDIQVLQWGPIKFKHDIWSTFNTGGLIQNQNIFSGWLSSSDKNSTLEIENLWWYTLFQIKSDLNFEKPEQKYQIWKKIWNKNVLIQSSEIK
jgi:hypothetical protein